MSHYPGYPGEPSDSTGAYGGNPSAGGYPGNPGHPGQGGTIGGPIPPPPSSQPLPPPPPAEPIYGPPRGPAYPAAPPPSSTGPDPANGSPRRRRTLIIATVLGVLVAGGTTAVLTLGGDDKDNDKKSAADSSPTQSAPNLENPQKPGSRINLAVKWSLPGTARTPGESRLGRWVTPDGIYIGTTSTGIVRYSAADGSAQTSPPAPAMGQLCGMSQTTKGSLGAIALGDGRTCSRVAVIDLKTNQIVFNVAFTKVGRDNTPQPMLALSAMHLAMNDDILVAAGDNGVIAYDIKSGTQRWSWNTGLVGLPNAEANGLLVDKNKILVGASDITSKAATGVALDTAGKLLYHGKFDKGPAPKLWPVSLDPPVYIAQAENSEFRALVLDNAGNQVQNISAKGDWGDLNLEGHTWGSGSGYREFPLQIKDGVLYATNRIPSAAAPTVVAMDLATGKPKWVSRIPAGPLETGTRPLIATTRDGVVLVTGSAGQDSRPLGVWQVASTDGKYTELAGLPNAPKELVDIGVAYSWFQDSLYAVGTSLSTQVLAARLTK